MHWKASSIKFRAVLSSKFLQEIAMQEIRCGSRICVRGGGGSQDFADIAQQSHGGGKTLGPQPPPPPPKIRTWEIQVRIQRGAGGSAPSVPVKKDGHCLQCLIFHVSCPPSPDNLGSTTEIENVYIISNNILTDTLPALFMHSVAPSSCDCLSQALSEISTIGVFKHPWGLERRGAFQNATWGLYATSLTHSLHS